MNPLVYTCHITGVPVADKAPRTPTVLVTDLPPRDNGWKHVHLVGEVPPEEHRSTYKFWKILGPWALGMEHDWSLYVELPFLRKRMNLKIAEGWLSHHDMAVPRHPKRSCGFDEIKACLECPRTSFSLQDAKRAMDVLERENLWHNSGMWHTGILARRLCDNLKNYMERWLSLTDECGLRDQIPAALVFNEIPVFSIPMKRPRVPPALKP